MFDCSVLETNKRSKPKTSKQPQNDAGSFELEQKVYNSNNKQEQIAYWDTRNFYGRPSGTNLKMSE